MKILQTITFIFFATYICFAQETNYHVSQISIGEGLSHNTVECVFKDSEGFMWFGTHNGLDRYDGVNIKSFKNKIGDTLSLSSNQVSCISEDRDGYLWVGTLGNGLNRFDKKTETFKRYQPTRGENSIPNYTIRNIKTFDNGTLWICTQNGLSKYDKLEDRFINYYPKNAMSASGSFVVYDIILGKNNNYYVATNHSYIYEFDDKTDTFTPIVYPRELNLPGNYRKHLIEDNNGNLWISGFDHGLIKYNLQNKTSTIFTTENSKLKSTLLNGDLLIRNNQLWLTTDGDGIIVLNTETNTFNYLDHNPSKQNSLYDNKIYSIYIDEQDIVWVGTFSEGVNIMNPNQIKFNSLTDKNGDIFSLNGHSVLSLFEDSKGNLWFGTDGEGLFRFDKNKEITQFQHDPDNPNSLSTNRIVCINENKQGQLLLGSYTGGFMIFDPDKNKVKRYLPEPNNPNSISAFHVWDIFIDSQDRIWLGMLGTGLELFDPVNETFTHFGSNTDNYNRINHDNVMGIIEDRDGDVWFGTEGRGVNILDNQTRQMYHSINSLENQQLSNNNVRCLYEDSEGLIWIGTSNGGANCYNKKEQHIKYFYIEDGLPSNIINSIIEDENNCIWMGTAFGVSKYHKLKNTFQNFDIYDGLSGYVCNRNAILKQDDGTIIIGTTNGFNVFKPSTIKKLNHQPTTYINELRIQNQNVKINDTVNGRIVLTQDINYTKKLTIKPKDKIFTLGFGVLSYTLPQKSNFKYKLEGFDNTWQTTDANRQFASYSNLKPGKYIFKLKASNSDDIWSDDETKLRIIVEPSFWQSVWFKFVIVFWILIIFYGWYRYKINIKDKQYLREKEKQDQQIMHLEKEKLESELNNQTFNILSRNKALLKHKRRLNLLLIKVDEKTKKTLTNIIQDIDQEINEEKDWKHIEPRLDKVYNNFMTSLKTANNGLTQSELRIAAYVRMGLSTKEIAELMQKTTKAIDNDRYRLRKKLNIPINGSLKKYLLDL